jgi:hypothetical protein
MARPGDLRRAVWNLHVDMAHAHRVPYDKVKDFFKNELVPDLQQFLTNVELYLDANYTQRLRGSAKDAFNRLQDYLKTIKNMNVKTP